jgi:hypothetical protein
MKIEDWLERFKKYWESKDLQKLLSLFSDDVVYYETPFVKLKSKEEILKEWQGVLLQDNIKLDYSIFSNDRNKSTVNWELHYSKDNVDNNLKGTYLIELDSDGLCTYFHQTCESR